VRSNPSHPDYDEAETNALVPATNKKTIEAALPNTTALAKTINDFPENGRIANDGGLSIKRYPGAGSLISVVHFLAIYEGKEISIVASCMESGPQVDRIVFANGSEFVDVLRTDPKNPLNHGMTQVRIDGLTEYVRSLSVTPRPAETGFLKGILGKFGKRARNSIFIGQKHSDLS
jgi:hypothetical protein